MKKFLLSITLFLLCAALAAPAVALESMVLPTGVLYYNADKAFDGYTLIAPTGVKTAYLLNMEGDVVHSWKLEWAPGLHGELLPNGNLLIGGVVQPQVNGIGGHGGVVQEYSWDGEKVWEYKMYNDNEVQHHTFFRMPNGNTLILGWERLSKEDAVKLGRDPKTIPEKPISSKKIEHNDFWMDFVREVTREGQTVWEWHVKDHLGQGPKKLDFNYILPLPLGGLYPNYDWSHFNTVGYVPETDQIIVNSRNFAEFFLLNHKTGEIEYRWGNPTTYDPKAKKPGWIDNGDQIVWGAHHANYIGNNHVLVFDNGDSRPEGQRSSAVEVDLKTSKIVWQYTSKSEANFFSFRQGAAQRLENGNTLITSTDEGHVFEVTPEKEVVWDFVNPVTMSGDTKCILSDAEDSLTSMGHDFQDNMIHRSYRYGKNYEAFAGKDMSVVSELGEGCPKFFKVYKKGATLGEGEGAGEASGEPKEEDGPQTMHAY